MHNLDFAYQYDSQTWDQNDYELDMDISSFNFDYSLMTVNEGGFSFIFGANFGCTDMKASLASLDLLNGIGGSNLAFKFGWGGTPVNTDRILLSLHGFLALILNLLHQLKSMQRPAALMKMIFQRLIAA